MGSPRRARSLSWGECRFCSVNARGWCSGRGEGEANGCRYGTHYPVHFLIGTPRPDAQAAETQTPSLEHDPSRAGCTPASGATRRVAPCRDSGPSPDR